MEELSLYRRFRDQGDLVAFNNLQACLRAPMFAIARRSVRDYQLAEDVVQVAWMNITRASAWKRIESNLHFRRWVLVIVRRAASRIQQRGEREPTLTDTLLTCDDLAGDTLAAAEVAQLHEDLELLQRCLARLPEGLASVVRLYHLEGLTLKRVANLLGIAISTAHRREHVGITALARCLGGLDAGNLIGDDPSEGTNEQRRECV